MLQSITHQEVGKRAGNDWGILSSIWNSIWYYWKKEVQFVL